MHKEEGTGATELQTTELTQFSLSLSFIKLDFQENLKNEKEQRMEENKKIQERMKQDKKEQMSSLTEL